MHGSEFAGCNRELPFQCAGKNVTVCPIIPRCSACFFLPLPHSLLLPLLPLSLFPLLHLLPAIYRRPSISPACQRAFSFGVLLQGARRWQITTRHPVIFDLSEPPSPPTPPSASHTHYPRQLPTHLRPPLFSPTFHIFLFRSVQKMWLASPETKKKTPMKYCGCGSV